MALPIRLTEEQEKQLSELMITTGKKTKNGCIVWLIENGKQLIEDAEKHKEIRTNVNNYLKALDSLKNQE